MTDQRQDRAATPKEDPRRESGLPGGGAGRVDETGKSGVYPASGPFPPGNAPIQWAGSVGQGDRPEGYNDSGDSGPEVVQNILRQQQEADARQQAERQKQEQQETDK